ncbi:protein unc-45 [Entomortierella parvispora]|uniref:Protein unc-45 n=1 Tax=Entomortierella parvispora TaxID=205924 RepID=A0A9P3M235_9FUNG|nr:protein unc-45 [Entomortierella parvispora]
MSASAKDEPATITERLQALETSSDILPAQITELSSALIISLSQASTETDKDLVRTQQQLFLDHSATRLESSIPSEDAEGKKVADLLLIKGAIVKGLLRMVMNDSPFAGALLSHRIYSIILRLPSDTISEMDTVPTTASATTRAVTDIKPMVAILLSKTFEMAPNKDAVRDRSIEIVLTDIGSDKVKTRSAGFGALGLIVQADMTIGAGILNKEGLLVELMDCIELEPEDMQISLTETLSMACADAKTRTAIGLHCSEFLKSIVLKGATKNQHLKGAAAVALTKISLAESRKDPSVGMNGLDGAAAGGAGSSKASSAKGAAAAAAEEAQLAKLFSGLLKDDKNDSNSAIQLNAVEGLAYASIQPPVKHLIISDRALLLSLFHLAEETKSNPLKYGLIIIFNNLTAFRKRLSPEQEQMLKLKKMAGAMPKSESGRLSNQDHDDPLDDEPVVIQRCVTLVKLGVMPALHAIGAQASENIRQSLAQVLRNVITPTETRGLLVQQGVVRLLMPMALQQPTQQSSSSEGTKTAATQALAKLSITLDPRLTFKNQRIPELVKPLIWLLESTDQLCQFESLMALTNLGSMGDVQVLGLIVQDGGIEKMENLQFSEHNLVRRAATEALCNMIFFEPVFEMYSDPKKSKNKIHLMLALCDTDDFMTRRAASGALAVLSTSQDVCKMIMVEGRGLEILTSFITLGVPNDKSDDPAQVEARAIEDVMSDQESASAAVIDHATAVGRMDELRHRGAECVKNLVTIGGKEISEKIAAQGGIMQLANLIKASESDAVRHCAMEALKAMSEQGIKLSS